MARIQINDLPLLQDLTEEQLKELFGAGASFKPGLEALEDRQLMSGFGSMLASAQLPTLSPATLKQGAQAATNLNQPMQVIYPNGPVAPVANNVIPADTVAPQTQASPLAALLQNQTVADQQTNPVAALQQVATSDTAQQTNAALAAALSHPTQTFYDGKNQPTPNFLPYDQEQGRVAIANKVAQLGSGLGNPYTSWGNSSGDSLPTTDGIGRFQAFKGATIYWSPATAKMDIEGRGIDPSIAGAHLITGPILDFYLGNRTVGYPTSDTESLRGRPGSICNSFYNKDSNSFSLIVHTPLAGTYVLSGAILGKWLQLGGGAYGAPVSNQYNIRGAVAQDFERGVYGADAVIISSAQTGTHDVVGQTLDGLKRYGGTDAIGTPTTDSTVFSASGNKQNAVVHFRKFVNGDGLDSALGTTAKGTFLVYGNIYTAWFSRSLGKELGIPISDEHNFSMGGRTFRVSTFLSANGVIKSIYWSPDRAITNWGVAALAGIQGGESHYYLDKGDGQGPQIMNFAPRSGPTGFEPVVGATGSPLSTGHDPFPLYEESARATNPVWANPLLSDSALASTASLWSGSGTVQAASVDYASLFGQAMQPIQGSSDSSVYSTDLSPFARAVAGSDSQVANIGGVGSIAPYFTLPRLNSNPGAAKTIFLDFMGGPVDQDFLYQATPSTSGGTADAILHSGGPVNLRSWDVPRFDLDGNTASFSAAEQAVIKEIWQRVAEDFAPFDVNVTTDWLNASNDRNTLRIVVGGRSVAAPEMVDPYGLSQFDSMKQGGPNVAFVFADSIKDLGGHFATLAANVASREAGHAFGLQYQLQNDRTSGKSDITPQANIMGTRIGVELSRWASEIIPLAGAVSPNAWSWQDDIKVLTTALGLRDHGQYGGFTNLGNLDVAGTLQAQGIIVIPFAIRSAENPGQEAVDVDKFIFDTQGGRIHFAVQGVGAGQNLGAHFEVWDSLKKVGESPTLYGDLNAALTLNLPAGTYTVKVMGGAGFEYGNYGQYTLTIQTANLLDQTVAYENELNPIWTSVRAGVAQSQQQLQGALDLQAQYTAERGRIEADLQAATDLSSLGAAANLADLQASHVQIMAALDQNQGQIDLLQNQLDLFTGEQARIGTDPAQVGVASANENPAADTGLAQPLDLTNASFSLTVPDTGETHQLEILSQTTGIYVRPQLPDAVMNPVVRPQSPNAPEQAVTFTGLWDPANGGFQVTGTLSHDVAGNMHIHFTWGSFDDGTYHSFDGTLSGVVGSYHIDAITIARPGGDPVHLIGDQTQAQASPVADFTNVGFALTDDYGVAHALQIQTQTAQPVGTTFTGVWDGQSGAGTLAYDAAGNVHLTFSADNYSFDGAISGAPGAYHIDGSFAVLGSDPVHVFGDQTV